MNWEGVMPAITTKFTDDDKHNPVNKSLLQLNGHDRSKDSIIDATKALTV